MKNVLLLIVLSIISLTSFAQTNNLTVFSEKGEEFTLYVNSVKQNETPAANVTAKDIKGESFMARLVFTDNSIPEITQNFWTESKNVEISAVVKQNNKGKYVLRSMGENPKTENTQVTSSGTQATYEDPGATHTSSGTSNNNTTTTVVTTETVSNGQSGTDVVNIGVNANENGMNLTTTAGGETVNVGVNANENGMNLTTTAGGETVNVGVNVSETGMNMTTGVDGSQINMNVDLSGFENMDLNTDSSVTSSSTTTTTTTTTTSTSGNTDFAVSETSNYSHSSGTVTRCVVAMSSVEFDEVISSIKSKSFEDSKLATAKQICKSSCMTADQIRDINKAFSFEDSRLEFAKYAYDYVYDSSKYYKVNDSFQFEMTAEELDEYLQTK